MRWASVAKGVKNRFKHTAIPHNETNWDVSRKGYLEGKLLKLPSGVNFRQRATIATTITYFLDFKKLVYSRMHVVLYTIIRETLTSRGCKSGRIQSYCSKALTAKLLLQIRETNNKRTMACWKLMVQNNEVTTT